MKIWMDLLGVRRCAFEIICCAFKKYGGKSRRTSGLFYTHIWKSNVCYYLHPARSDFFFLLSFNAAKRRFPALILKQPNDYFLIFKMFFDSNRKKHPKWNSPPKTGKRPRWKHETQTYSVNIFCVAKKNFTLPFAATRVPRKL